MSKTTVRFNNVDLTKDFVVSDLVRPFLSRNVEIDDVDGRDGGMFRTQNYTSIDITMTLTFLSLDKGERVKALANLVKTLDVVDPTPLYISDDNGWYYLAIPSGGSISRWIGAESFPLTFHCPDPARYGETKTVTTTGSEQSYVQVGGNTYSYPIFELQAKVTELAQGAYTQSLNLTNSGYGRGKRTYIAIDLTTTATRYYKIDCLHREVMYKTTASGAWSRVVPQIGSDFGAFYPGWANAGFTAPSSINEIVGNVTTTWVERWL